MAVKKKVSKKKVTSNKKTGQSIAVRKSKGGQLAKADDVTDLLADYASKQSARENLAGGSKLTTKNGKFILGDTNLGETVDVIVLAFSAENRFYDSAYAEDSPSSPTCFAVAQCEERDLVPHDNSIEKQADECSACELNVWGSAETGRGKACSNRRRLMLLDADEEDFEMAEIVEFNIGPSSLTNWKSYIKDLNDKIGIPSFGCVTTLSLDEDFDYPVIQFECKEKITRREPLQQIMTRIDQADEKSVRPYDPSQFATEDSAPKGSGKKKAKKKRTGKFSK